MSRRDNLVKRKRSKTNIYETNAVKRKGPRKRGKKILPLVQYEYPPPPPNAKYAVVNKSHGRQLAEDLKYDVCRYKVSHMAQYDGIIFPGPFYHKILTTLGKFHRKYPKKRIIIWWIGSDAMKALSPKYDKTIPKAIAYKHLCVSVGLQKELASIGISANILPLIPPVSRYKIAPLPARYTVAVYIPFNSPQKQIFYRWDDCRTIMEKTPYIRYIVYGNKNPLPDAPKNCTVKGWVTDTVKILAKSNCLLRLTMHDGFPKSIIEATLMGRCVITNHDYPYVIQSNNINEIVNIIKSKPVIDNNATEYYQSTYTKQHLVEGVEQAWE